MRRKLFVLLTAMAATALWARPADADARKDYLIQVLRTSSTFRVRAQAALSLARISREPRVIQALSEALQDVHPAVRAAAAASLEELEDPAAIPALQRARSDSNHTARLAVDRALAKLEGVARAGRRGTEPVGGDSGGARFYVGIGTPGAKATDISDSALKRAREAIERQVRQIPGVVVAPPNESKAQADRVIRSKKLTGYYLDSSIVQVREPSPGTLRAEVSVIVASYPGRDIRMMLRGAVTVQGGGSGDFAREQAVEGALGSALRRLGQALNSGSPTTVSRAGP